MILLFIVILKCHNNRNQKEIFNTVISPTQHYHKYHDYQNSHCSETFISVKYFPPIFTILVLVALTFKWYIVIISIIVIITLMIYRDMKSLLLSIPSHWSTVWHKILTGKNINKFDKFQAIRQYFPIRIFHSVSYLPLMNLWLFGSTQSKIISVRCLL